MVDEDEIAYYRAVEDLFAALRGVPHVLSARDFQLLRTWWREAVPLAAVAAGVREVMARRSERGEGPVVSLTYCRHAVRRQARRLAEMRTGAGEGAEPVLLEGIAGHLRRSAAAQEALRPAVARVLAAALEQLADLQRLPPDAIEGALWDLEATLLDGCRRALDAAERAQLTQAAAAAAVEVDAAARERAERAHGDRLLRLLLDLPRLELP